MQTEKEIYELVVEKLHHLSMQSLVYVLMYLNRLEASEQKEDDDDLSVWDEVIQITYQERHKTNTRFHQKIDMLFV